MIKNDNLQSDKNTTYSGASELWSIEGALKNYNYNLVGVMTSFFKRTDRILEFGAGIGTLAILWSEQTGVVPECVEIDPNLRKELSKRNIACYANLTELTGCYDGIYTSNVLEHIEDDVSALINLREKLKPESNIAIYVPAFQFLYSKMDSAVGHYRRYGKKELRQKLESAGFNVKHIVYSDSIGFFVWVLLKLMGSEAQDSLSNIDALIRYDKYILPLSKFLDKVGFKYILGKNILAVAKRNH